MLCSIVVVAGSAGSVSEQSPSRCDQDGKFAPVHQTSSCILTRVLLLLTGRVLDSTASNPGCIESSSCEVQEGGQTSDPCQPPGNPTPC